MPQNNFMIKEDTEAFLAGLIRLETAHPVSFKQYGEFKICAIIYRDDITNELNIKAARGIEKETMLWWEIRKLFDEIAGWKRNRYNQ